MSENLQGLSSCCTSGHLHEGTPQGKVIELAGMKSYVTGEASNKAKTILFITDIFGYELPNARLLADEYAKSGDFYVVMPDFFDGDYVSHDLLKAIAPQQSDPEPGMVEKAAGTAKVGASLGPWLARHREGVSKPLIEKAVVQLRQDPEVKKLAAVGFCWGARYAFLLGAENANPKVDAIVGNHPSFLVVPGEIDPVNVPAQINVGDSDAMMSLDQANQAKEILSKKPIKSEVNIFPGAVHGFAVRGDQNKEEEKKWKDEAANNTMRFLKANL